MSTYTDASLIVTPNAKKAGKLYSLKPTDGTGDLDVVRATTATYVDADGVIQTALANEPRFDYTNGSCPSILVEPQRTNLVFPSATATTQTRTVTATAHTLSFYGTGSVVLSGVATGTLVGTGANNKVTLTFTPTAGSLILTVVGSVTNWQLEAGENATSYIPTVASTVTRNADVISKSGISSLIGQTEGTIFADINFNNSVSGTEFSRIIELTDGTNTNRIIISFAPLNTLLTRVTANNIEQASFQATSISLGRLKVALSYSVSGVRFFVNGTLMQSNLSATIPSTNRLNIGYQGSSTGSFLTDTINSALVFPTQLTDQECIALTTL